MSIARLAEVREAFEAALVEAGTDSEKVEGVRIAYAGKRSGVLQELAAALRELPNEDRRDYGRALNDLKKNLTQRLAEAKAGADAGGAATARRAVDVTLPGRRLVRGAQHPVHLVRRRIGEIFRRIIRRGPIRTPFICRAAICCEPTPLRCRRVS